MFEYIKRMDKLWGFGYCIILITFLIMATIHFNNPIRYYTIIISFFTFIVGSLIVYLGIYFNYESNKDIKKMINQNDEISKTIRSG